MLSIAVTPSAAVKLRDSKNVTSVTQGHTVSWQMSCHRPRALPATCQLMMTFDNAGGAEGKGQISYQLQIL